MSIRPGDYVKARALPCDGGRVVRGFVLDVRSAIVLLDLPHGRWCTLASASKLPTPASPRFSDGSPRGVASRHELETTSQNEEVKSDPASECDAVRSDTLIGDCSSE